MQVRPCLGAGGRKCGLCGVTPSSCQRWLRPERILQAGGSRARGAPQTPQSSSSKKYSSEATPTLHLPALGASPSAVRRPVAPCVRVCVWLRSRFCAGAVRHVRGLRVKKSWNSPERGGKAWEARTHDDCPASCLQPSETSSACFYRQHSRFTPHAPHDASTRSIRSDPQLLTDSTRLVPEPRSSLSSPCPLSSLHLACPALRTLSPSSRSDINRIQPHSPVHFSSGRT